MKKERCLLGCLDAKAFTLIELLVVVLIIGILAAVALPQYQRAVDKSRLVQFITAVKSVKQAEEAYYLANGEYTTDWDALNIGFAGTASGSVFTTTNGMTLQLIKTGPTTTAKVNATYTKLPDISIYHVFDHSGISSTFDNKLYCHPLSSKEASHQLCKSMSSAPSGEACGNGLRCYVVDKF